MLHSAIDSFVYQFKLISAIRLFELLFIDKNTVLSIIETNEIYMDGGVNHD